METNLPVAKKLENHPGQRGEIALGTLPFLLIGLATLLMQAPVSIPAMQVTQTLGGIFFIGGYLVILYGLLRGWLLGFPRWVYPYLVYAIVFTYFLTNVATPGLEIFGVPLFGRELWGWRGFVPLGIVAVLALIISRPPWGNLVRLGVRIWNDWTLLSFGLYGLMILATLFTMDEVERSFRFPPTLLVVILVILGALGYMRLGKSWQRIGVLLVCAGLSIALMLAAADYFWQTHSMNFSTGESQVLDVTLDVRRLFNLSITGAVIALLVLLVPLPLGLLRWLWQRFRPTEQVEK
jgi:hypothetical protein